MLKTKRNLRKTTWKQILLKTNMTASVIHFFLANGQVSLNNWSAIIITITG